MDAFATPRYPTTGEREFQALRTLVASAGLLPVLSVSTHEQHLARLAEAELDRLVHLGGVHPSAIRICIGAARRWIGDALIRAGRRLEGTPGAAPSQDLTLGHGGATS